ncbi:MAG: von Willebrand factor type A domain-containing protein, partial [Pseudomonadota bacterium]
MNDEFDDLKQAMKAATPAPDAAQKAAHLAMARKNFETLQGSEGEARPTSDRPKPGIFRGVREMLNTMSTRGALTASTAFVALGLVVVVPDWQKAPHLFDVGYSVNETEPAPVQTESADAATSGAAPELAIAAEPAPVMMAEPMAQGATALSGQQDRAYTRAVPLPGEGVVVQIEGTTEAFANADQNPLKVTLDEPVSTFSIDVDTASYSFIRSALMNGQMPPVESVRIEEMVNYFPYEYAEPQGNQPFETTITVTDTPWNPDTQLLHIGIQGEKPALEDRPPLNLVFLIDTSGSMDAANKLPLLKQSLALMLP